MLVSWDLPILLPAHHIYRWNNGVGAVRMSLARRGLVLGMLLMVHSLSVVIAIGAEAMSNRNLGVSRTDLRAIQARHASTGRSSPEVS